MVSSSLFSGRAFLLSRGLLLFAVIGWALLQQGWANPAALPEVGTHELRVLSPTLLELTLVTTKDPDPAPVTTWNFVGANFSLNLPGPEEFKVMANGRPIPVARAGFRRRPIYAPLKTRDLRIGNSIYLQLGAPVMDHETITVQNASGTLWDNETNPFRVTVDPVRFSPAIHVNQVGYLPNFSKKAMVGYYLGSLGEMAIPGTTFHILEANTQAVRFTGALEARPDVGYTYNPAPYQNVYQADFSAFTTPGEYVLQVPGLGVSYKFLIHEGTAAVFARTLALGLYHQRCGGSNQLPYTRHEHGACHSAPAEVPTAAHSAVNATLANVSADFASNPLHTAPQLSSVDASLYPFINRAPVDVRRGHHDAGDYSKYTINSAGLIHHLVFAADAFPGVAALDNLGLPESGDGRSDLLQEAQWEADFLAKMQDADGGFYFLVYPRDRRYEDDVLPDHGDPQVVFPKTTAATAVAVAALAEIASSPAFKTQFPMEAAAYLEKARLGWDFLVRALDTHGKNGAYQKITHYGNEFMHDDELAWAAAAMFAATGDRVFHDQLKAWYDPSDPDTRRWTWWRLFEGYGCAARTYAFAARTGRLPAASLDPAYLAKCQAEILAAGDDIARFSEQNAYGTSFPDLNKAYRSAGWYFSSERSFDLAVATQLEAKPRYLEALISNLNYEGGVNPVNMPYITGLGWQRWRDIVHQYAQNDYQTLPPSGLPLGNIQAGFAYLDNYKQSLGQLCYPPDGASTAPYPFYDRWGDSFNTTTEFVIVDQSRALGALAFLMAGTGLAPSPYTRATAAIASLPASVPAGQTITATFQAAGADLTHARILWEARDQQPFIGPVFTFAARSPGVQWIEAEALLPDGRRLFCKTNFTATYSTAIPPNEHQSAPLTAGSGIAALYHLDGGLADAANTSSPLTLAGNARFSDVNLGWMASRSGQALRFDDLGDKASVTIPASALFGVDPSEIRLEAMVFVEAYKGWNRASARLLSLERSWNASLNWFEDLYTGAHVSGGTALDCTGATLESAMPIGSWHHLSIALSSTAYSVRVNGKLIASVASGDQSNWPGGSAVLEFGNFSGWIDEVVIRGWREGDPGGGTPTPPETPEPTPSMSAATFAGNDSQTKGSWQGTYGADGAMAPDSGWTYPPYVQVKANYCHPFTWENPSTRPFALLSSSGATRFATGYRNANPMYFNFNFNDATPHRVSFYFVDFDDSGRQQKLEFFDRFSGQLLASTNLADFQGGLYSTWNLKGRIRAKISRISGPDCVVSALFFDPAHTAPSPTPPATPNTVRYLGVDLTTGGTWKGAIGGEGWRLAGEGVQIPSFATVTLTGETEHVWNWNTTDGAALQKTSSTDRLAACWYAANSFDARIRLTDDQPHRISFYCLDWDIAGRTQQVEVLDTATGAVLHRTGLAAFQQGAYLSYEATGDLTFRFTRTGPLNAVVSGLFFD